jgi:hypothetical protein
MVTTSLCPLIGCDTMPEPGRQTRTDVLEAPSDTLIDMLDCQRSAAPNDRAAARDDIQSLVRERVAAALEVGGHHAITVIVARDSRRGNDGH